MKTMKKIITLSTIALLFSVLGSNISFAGKPTGGGGGKKVNVESASPSSVVQTQEEDVTILGSGFDNGSTVRFLVTGTTDDSQIEVGPAQYISPNELKVRIKTNGSTPTVDYDIEVQATSGRKGKGTTLFKVQQAEITNSCSDYVSSFPDFAFTKIHRSTRGSVAGFDIILSNADGDCNVVVYSSNGNEITTDISYRQIGNTGTIAWRQNANENAGRKDADKIYDNLRMIRFQVANKEVTSSLPASVNVLKTSGETPSGVSNGISYVSLSPDGNKVAYTYTYSDSNARSIREIDISSCTSNCADSIIHTLSNDGAMRGLSYSAFGDRIYFASGFRDTSSNPLHGQSFIAFIENQSGVWSAPRYLTTSGNGFYGNDYSNSDFKSPDVAIADLGNGMTEVVAFSVKDTSAGGIYRVQVMDVGSCTAAGTGDCLSSDESSIVSDIPNAQYASFDRLINANGLLYSSSSSDDEIFRYDFVLGDTGIVAAGWHADSAD